MHPDGNQGVLPKAVGISAIWLVRIGDHVEVRIEQGKKWTTVIRERADGSFSHIVEASGMPQG